MSVLYFKIEVAEKYLIFFSYKYSNVSLLCQPFCEVLLPLKTFLSFFFISHCFTYNYSVYRKWYSSKAFAVLYITSSAKNTASHLSLNKASLRTALTHNKSRHTFYNHIICQTYMRLTRPTKTTFSCPVSSALHMSTILFSAKNTQIWPSLPFNSKGEITFTLWPSISLL